MSEFTEEAHEALGMTLQDQQVLRTLVTVELLAAQSGITDEQIQTAYQNRLKQEILAVSNHLKDLAEGQ